MFVKLFASMYEGTLRGRSDELLVFTNLLAHSDQYGVVDRHWRAISDETGLPIDRVKEAIKTLSSPDKESRSSTMEGRRIYCFDGHREWGWKIVNYGKYRAIRSEEDRKEQNRLAQERWRNKQKSNNNKPRKPKSAQAEVEVEVEVEESKSLKPLSVIGTRLSNNWNLPDEWAEWASKEKQMNYPEVKQMAHQFKDYWIAVPGTKGKKLDWAATWRNWVRNNRGNGKVKEMSQTAKAIALLEGMK